MMFHELLFNESIKSRFAVSLVGNVVRGGALLLTGMLLARGLGPGDYGNLMFLLASFMALWGLITMGSADAFFTFASQKARPRQFYLCYFCWQLFQLILGVLLLGLILPDRVLDRVWIGQNRSTILLAFLASFMSVQVWTTIRNIGEAWRKTVLVHLMINSTLLAHLVAIVIAMALNWLSIHVVLIMIILEYVLVAVWAYHVLKKKRLILEVGG